MISLQPSAGEPANNSEPTDAAQEDRKPEVVKKRIPLASIPTTISIGLLIAMMYLGARIVAAHRAAKPAVTQAAIVKSTPEPVTSPAAAPKAEAQAPPKVTPPVPQIAPQKVIAKAEPAPASKPAAITPDGSDEIVPTITPQPGQRFIQVGALDLDAKDTHKFVRRLRGKNFDPHVAPGPTPVLSRVLIGPFDNLDALNEKKAQLETEGIATFVRKY